MTKARDLANAGTALTTVSATELGYLDGVTSAVQTQLNAKQPTVANVSDTEIGYLDGVTSAIQTQINGKQAIVANVSDTEIGYLDGVTSAIQTQLNGRIASTIVDAKGDLISATANDTPARLAVGTNGQVLKANSATATGLEWGAASATKNYSLLGTASLASAGTITISGLSGYDNLMVTVSQANGPNNAIFTVRFNASTLQYPQFGLYISAASAYSVGNFQANDQPGANAISFANKSNNVSSFISGVVQVLGAAGSGVKAWTSAAGVEPNGAATAGHYVGGGVWEGTAAITSVSILCNAGGNNFTGGTMKVYGAV